MKYSVNYDVIVIRPIMLKNIYDVTSFALKREKSGVVESPQNQSDRAVRCSELGDRIRAFSLYVFPLFCVYALYK